MASTARGFMLRLEARVQLALGVGILEDRLDDDVGLGDAAAFDVGGQPRHRLVALRRVRAALLEELARALERGLRRTRGRDPAA